MDRQYGLPYLVERDGDNVETTALALLSLAGKGEQSISEGELQALIFRHPDLLPVEEIDPIFGPLTPLCCELPTAAGYPDIVFINELGLLTIVECKLWRNPEARRKVVGQILDYASELSSWDYGKLQSAVAEALREPGLSLYEAMRKKKLKPGKESSFIDNVNRNLRRGRFLLLIVGDGIRERVEAISDFLQNYAHLNFSFGLVETTIYQLPQPRGQTLLVQPRVLAKTVEIERAVVRVEEQRIVVKVPSPKEVNGPVRPTNITEQFFFEFLADIDPELRKQAEAFIEKTGALGLIIDPTKAFLMIKTEDKRFNFAGLSPKGYMRNYGIASKTEELGYEEIGETYLERLAALLPEAEVDKSRGKFEWTVQKRDGSYVPISECLAVQDAWLALIKDTLDQLKQAIDEG